MDKTTNSILIEVNNGELLYHKFFTPTQYGAEIHNDQTNNYDANSNKHD